MMSDFEFVKQTLDAKSGVHGYRQTIADTAGVSKSLIDKIARGYHTNIGYNKLTKIADAMREYGVK